MPSARYSPQFLIFIAMLLISCRPDSGRSKLQWGHFTELDRAIDISPFLLAISPSETLHVCIYEMPASLDKAWLEAEIFSAINLWAMQIGRALKVEFDGCQQKPSLRILFAEAPISGSFIGYTNFEENERRIYLNPEYHWEDSSETLGFRNLTQFKNKDWRSKAAFLFPLLAAEAYSSIKLGKPGSNGRVRQPSLGILLHELGHAFGLCDLYQDNSPELGFNSNCSSVHRSSSLNPSEIMTSGTRPGTARFSLSSGDKEGLRALVRRSGFPKQAWSRSKELLSADEVLAQLKFVDLQENDGRNDFLSLSGPQGQVMAQRSGELKSILTVEAPLSVTAITLFDTRGRGPFLQLMEDDSKSVNGKRVWQVQLDLSVGSYQYEAVDSNQPQSGKAELAFEIIPFR